MKIVNIFKVGPKGPKTAIVTMAHFGGRHGAKREDLRRTFRLQVGLEIEMILGERKNVPKDLIAETAKKLGISRRSVLWIAKEFWAEIQNPRGICLQRQKKENSGRPNAPLETVGKKFLVIRTCSRWMIREMPESAEIPKSALHRRLYWLRARRFTQWVKPCLTERQKQERLRKIVKHVTKSGKKFEFMDFHHTLHSDEKWFYTVLDKKEVWILPDEGVPAPRVQNKTFIQNIMFIVVVEGPQRPNGTYFNSLVGVW